MQEEDAFHYLIQWLRNPSPSGYSTYGYEVYLPAVILHYLQSQEGL
jgi:hypothetical protein